MTTDFDTPSIRSSGRSSTEGATTVEVIAKRLAEAGCRFAFGMPGGEVLAMMDALDRADIRVVLVKHENCGGFMGEGAWHGGGGPAILLATIGPGVANAVNVIANAWQERVPMIVLTGSVPALEAETYTHQVFDHLALLRPVTKAVFRLARGTADVVVEKALTVAMSGRPGPVLLDLPMDVQNAGEDQWHPGVRNVAAPMMPSGDALETARRWLEQAERPLVLAGLDVRTQGADEAVAGLCRSLGAPLITTYKAKGVLPEDDPLAMGGAGLSPLCDQELLPLVHASDCVVLAGYDPIEMRIGWRNPFVPHQRIIDISAEINTHSMHQADLEFVGDIAASIRSLAQDLVSRSTWPNGEPAVLRDRLRTILKIDETWGPAAVIDEARKASPRDVIATADSGAHRILFSQIWESYVPGGVLQSSALCTMGSAVPLAIGRKLAEPDRPVIAFVGDAGMEMVLGELATARDLGLALPIVVFVDNQLALIELKQRTQGMTTLGVDFGQTDFVAVAQALGGHGAWVDNRDRLSQEITHAFERSTFTLIAATIGRNAYDKRI
ncbi:MAG: thiamine pyrophosphate-binding protein [Pseudomonadota bacterium]